MKKLLLISTPILLALLVGVCFITPPKANALSGSEFTAGRIIDDNIFFSPNSMNVVDIQNFLNAKVPVCDTWGTQPYAGTTRAAYAASKGYSTPFTCLKDYRQVTVSKAADGLCNGYGAVNQSAADIIYGVAQSCGVSPKVLIVLLQKEQSLVSDDWPWSIQYRSATGYGCPDTAACDSTYYGFFNQVYAAARVYKYYAAHPADFNYRAGRDNFVLYNPNSACGGSMVFLQNQATAGLYIYTPYQPNPAALSNLYGTGDGCSAYGNRNFWRMYRDWFGNTTGPGYEFVDAVNPPAQILPNDVTSVRIRIRNLSGTTWYGDGNVPSGQHPLRLATLGYANDPHGNPSDPNWLGTSNQVRMQESSVADGGIATFDFTYKGPMQQVDNYLSRFTPVLDGSAILPYVGMVFGVSTPTPNYGFAVTTTTGITKDMPTNYTRPVTYTIKNTGNVVWWGESGHPVGAAPIRMLTIQPFYHASVFYDASTWLANNQIKQSTNNRINPGQDAIFNFSLKTPATSSIYNENFGLVLDGAILYPTGSPINLNVNVADYSYSVVSTDIPQSLAQGQKYRAKIVLKNTGVATWYADGHTPASTYPIRIMSAGYQPYGLSDARDSSWITPGTQVKMATNQVAPGDNGEFSFDIIAPYGNGGDVLGDFRVVLDGLLIMQGAIQARTNVPARTGSYINQPAGIYPVLTSIAPGQIANGKLVVRNNTNFVWYSDDNRPSIFRGGAMRMVMTNPYYRTSAFSNSADAAWLGTSNQIKMSTAIVNPGEDAEFPFTWKAPAQSGTYTDRFSLVLDGYQLMPDIGMQFVTTVQ